MCGGVPQEVALQILRTVARYVTERGALCRDKGDCSEIVRVLDRKEAYR
jgi:hypothetical protein